MINCNWCVSLDIANILALMSIKNYCLLSLGDINRSFCRRFFPLEFLQPYKERPQTTASVARNLVAGALGLATRVPREKREEERKRLREARGMIYIYIFIVV